jgi:hypothetical protein
MRNVEEPGDELLLAAGTMVPDLVTTGASAEDRINSFRRAINNESRGAYFYHLSEGVDERARKHFFNLKENDLINKKLVGIHALGLHKEDLIYLKKKGAKIVWSPFSNQLLYGKTINLQDLKDSGVTFSLGCDWTPSGSKNILQELKIAYHVNKNQNDVFTSYELVQSVTSSAAKVAGWETHLGTLEDGKLADILVIKGDTEDPYTQLIRTVEKDVELVIVNGVPRYGNHSFMNALITDPENELEEITIAKTKKGVYLYSEESEINDIGFQEATDTLTDIMLDLKGFVERMKEEEAGLMSLGIDEPEAFTIELDNEPEPDFFRDHEEPEVIELFADVPMAESIDFDTATVEGENYWYRINAQKNISDDLKEWLKKCYQVE